MATVVLEENTVDELQTRAAANGLSVDEYIKLLLKGTSSADASKLTWSEVESLLDEHSHDGPTLPPDFSRADIYGEHN